MQILLPYGKSHLTSILPDDWDVRVVAHKPLNTPCDEQETVKLALHAPHGGKLLRAQARGKRTACIITSDHTRPVPSRITLPLLLSELRAENPDIQITILIATGCHRACTHGELMDKFGEDLLHSETFLIHDCDDSKSMRFAGILPSGGELWLNKAAMDADLLLAEGFIEPHFFAGFSGGRKSVLPGVAARKTVLYNHNSSFIQHECARAGCLIGNPIHEDMAAAAKMANLTFILNVILDEQKRIAAAFAGEPETAHAAGCAFLADHAGLPISQTPLVLTTNGGYPLDQNLYQCVKGLATAEQFCTDDGVIILAAACEDGLGGDSFYKTMAGALTPSSLLNKIVEIPADQTREDQWQYQILARILLHKRVILITDERLRDSIERMHMQYADTIEEAFAKAEIWQGKCKRITVIPDGVGVYATSE